MRASCTAGGHPRRSQRRFGSDTMWRDGLGSRFVRLNAFALIPLLALTISWSAPASHGGRTQPRSVPSKDEAVVRAGKVIRERPAAVRGTPDDQYRAVD